MVIVLPPPLLAASFFIHSTLPAFQASGPDFFLGRVSQQPTTSYRHVALLSHKMSSPSVEIQPQPSEAPKAVTPHSSPGSGPTNIFDIVRCSRCQRSMNFENDSSPGVVRFGMNSYYCSRCAYMVGFIR